MNSEIRLHNLRYRARHNTHPHDPDFMEPEDYEELERLEIEWEAHCDRLIDERREER